MITREKVAPRVGGWIETNLHLRVFWGGGSHPVWVRGLKHQFKTCVSRLYDFMSHPVWVRGLKQSRVRELQEEQKVAPRVGAWIETQQPELLKNREASHPVWVRGLKQRYEVPVYSEETVAPRVGAWIETSHLKGTC